MQKKEIFRYIQGKKEKYFDSIVNEHLIKLFINQRESFLFQTFPLDNDELVTGFLYSKKIISSIRDIQRSFFNELTNEYHISIQNGLKINYSSLTTPISRNINDTTFNKINDSHSMEEPLIVEKDKIFAFMEEFNSLSDVFDKTGAVHTAAISNTSEIKYYYDDIGRHNAIDKCLGKGLIDNVKLENKILLVTCRISSGIISKIINSRIPIIISRAPPTAYAIELGEKFGITIIGFCRGFRFNVYSHVGRIQD
ncbi:MAG: formate dehydrogenase accessory sulfurtransferase FdhD [Candidatus Heimdallarchaeota archaeon]|nr:MAG: formate dehydrogenase accessory sulfurtransferase FdhD [Candidatus Heimdallarchaeota archaeon]